MNKTIDDSTDSTGDAHALGLDLRNTCLVSRTSNSTVVEADKTTTATVNLL